MIPPIRRLITIAAVAITLLIAPPVPAVDLPASAPQAAAATHSDTAELIVFLKPGTDALTFARAHGMAIRRALLSDSNAFVLAAPTVAEARANTPVLRQDNAVIAVYPNRRTNFVRTAFIPDDPYFHRDTPTTGWRGQWHLINEWVAGRDVHVQGAWNRDITGAGVIIGICDDSFETTHPDLQPNYVAADSWDFGQDDAVPDPVYSTDMHGISVAGVAAARGGNAIGVTGAAPYAGLAGLRIDFEYQTDDMFVDATLYHSSGSNTNIKVKNHSYADSGSYIPYPLDVSALATSTAAGTIHCFAASNDRGTVGEDSAKKDLQNSPDAICVAAMGSDGKFSYYSCYGACVFVTAPSSSYSSLYRITTTDRTGEANGYNGAGDSFPDPDYTSLFGGTSSASPLAAGVIALVKQVQPALNVRFAKHLLALTSNITDATDATVASDGGWRTNAAGFHFNQNYGFGLIDADALTQQALLYTGVTSLTTETTGNVIVNTNIPDNDPAGLTRTFTFSSTNPLEEVRVYLNVSHAYRGEVVAYLTSPSGYTGRLMAAHTSDGGDDILWTFTTNAFWGENPAGSWSLNVRDIGTQATGRWNRYSVTARMGQLIPVACPYPPAVTDINPSNAENYGLLTGATITGSNFVADQMGAKLTLAGQPDIVATNINVISDTQMTCDFDLDGVAPGSWSLVVTKTDCVDDTLPDAFTVTLPIPPTFIAAGSVKTHGTAGDFTLDLLDANVVEPRLNGATTLAVTFDQPVQRLTGTNADVAVNVGSVTDVALDSNLLVVALADTAGTSHLTVSFPGIAATSNPTNVVVDILCFYTLTGDVNATLTINALDLTAVRARMGQIITSSNFLYDVIPNGSINALDLTAVRARMGQQVTVFCQ